MLIRALGEWGISPEGVLPRGISPEGVWHRSRFQSASVCVCVVGTGGHFLIRLGSQNEWDGQRDRGPEDGTIVKGL